MTEKLWDFEIRVAGDPAPLRGVVTSIEDAVERGRIAALVPADRAASKIVITLTPRPPQMNLTRNT